MSKAQTLVVVDKRDPRSIAAEAEARLKARRQGRTIYRLRRHLVPWWCAFWLLALAAAMWGLAAVTTTSTAIAAALALSPEVGFVGWMISRRTGQWRHRAELATALAAGWLIYAAWTGPSWTILLALVLLTIGLSLKYWKAIRLQHPLGPPPGTAEEDEFSGPTDERWRKFVAGPKGPLTGSRLTGHDTSQTHRERFTVMLLPGQQTLSSALANIDRIASGLDVPVRNLVLEPHPNESPTQLQLTVVTQSPIAKTVEYTGPKVEDGVIKLGPYADGEGYANWRLWTSGEVPNSGSAWGGFILGGMGSGKSRVMELITIAAMSTGWCETWFIDPQGGASSPALTKHADWAVDLDDAEKVLTALERFIDARGAEMASEGWIGFDPSPERPLLMVVIDECHEVFVDNTERWTTVARKIRKVGGAIVALSQYPGLSTFGGSEPLRSAICAGNVIVMRAESKQNGQLVPGLELDPMLLPDLPGFGYTVARRGHGRTAPYRSEYVTDPSYWYGIYPGPGLDRLSAHGCGKDYEQRHQVAEERMSGLRKLVERMRNGLGAAPEPKRRPSANQTATSAGAFPTVPAPPTFNNVQDKLPARSPEPIPAKPSNAREAILARLADGEAKTGELQAAAGVGETRTRELLKELIKAERMTKVGHGTYRLVATTEGEPMNTTTDLKRCSDCQAEPGTNHSQGCDWAACPECGEQQLLHTEHDDTLPAIWHGIDQKAEIARRLGWWTDHPDCGRVEDYDRVLIADARGEIVWNKETQRYDTKLSAVETTVTP
ncbi:MAG TPA: hypothetical protein VIP06_02970 [Nocardioides sp.]